MEIISNDPVVETVEFGALEDGEVFQREGSKKLYLKSSHSSGDGGNAVRLATGRRSTLKAEELVIVRSDAAVTFSSPEC